jgi:hypothetical protein
MSLLHVSTCNVPGSQTSALSLCAERIYNSRLYRVRPGLEPGVIADKVPLEKSALYPIHRFHSWPPSWFPWRRTCAPAEHPNRLTTDLQIFWHQSK